jgi:Tfp pilus assembly protein PilF
MDEHILAVNGQYDEFVLKLDKAKEFLRSQRFEEAKKVLLEIVAQEPNYVEANDFLYQIYEIEETTFQQPSI